MAMNMNGIMLHGRPMRVGRPSGFVRHESAHDALRCSHGLLRCNMLCCVATCGTLSRCAPAAPPRAHPSCSPRLASPRLASPRPLERIPLHLPTHGSTALGFDALIAA